MKWMCSAHERDEKWMLDINLVGKSTRDNLEDLDENGGMILKLISN
jgi:hypothetical protein